VVGEERVDIADVVHAAAAEGGLGGVADQHDGRVAAARAEQRGVVIGPAEWVQPEPAVVVDAGFQVLNWTELEQQFHRFAPVSPRTSTSSGVTTGYIVSSPR
jgi:hypothetical protein